MKTRKIILLSALVVFSCIFVLQVILSRSDSIKTITLSEDPDTIIIEKGSDTELVIQKVGGEWVLGPQKYPAGASDVESLVEALREIRVLYTASKGADDTRYGFEDEGGLRVHAKLGETLLRSMAIGKNTSTARQSYVRLDDASEILLVSGNLKSIFNVSMDGLREKEIYTLESGSISAFSITGPHSFRLEKQDGVWKVAASQEGDTTVLDTAKVDSWLSGIASLRASSFAPEGTLLSGTPMGEASIEAGDRKLTVLVYEKNENSQYLCSSSESPYLFYLPEYIINRYLKKLEELKKE